jgi:Transposase DDE domain
MNKPSLTGETAMRKNPCLHSLADIVSQFLTPRVWKRAHQAWQAKHAPSRWRLQALVWVLLVMAWGLGDSIEEHFVTARAAYVAHHLKVRRPGKSLAGFLHALGQLPMPVLRTLNCCLREQFAELFVDALRIHGWAPFACDGTRLLCPRSEKLQRHLGTAAKEESAPMLFLTALVLLPLGIPWTWRWGQGAADEHRHLRSMLPTLPPRSLLVLDACYPSYDLYERLKKMDMAFLVRVSTRSIFYTLDDDRRTDPEQLKRLRDRLVYYWPNKNAQKKGKPPIIVRLLRVCGKHGDVWLATNIINNDQLSRKTAAQVYRWRWRNEGLFRQYKHLLHKVKIASRSVRLVHREADGAMLALQLLLAHAARTTQQGKTTLIVMDCPRRMLLIIRSTINAALCRLGPRQLATYQFLLAKVRAEQRLRTSPRTRQIWPRRREHKPPKPPKLRVMNATLKAMRDKIYARIRAA